MQIAQVIGGYSLGSADLLRRAMGKKNAEEMAQQRDIFRRWRRQERRGQEAGERSVRPDGEVRRLRLQQIACRGLRAGRLPDRLPEGALPVRIHGRQLVGGDGRYRQGARHLRRRPRQRPGRAAARHEPGRLPLRAGGRARASVTAWARSRARASPRSAPSCARARKAGRFATCSISANASTSAWSTAAWSRRWCAPGPSTASIPTARGLFASVGIALGGGGAARAPRAAGQPVRRRRRRGRGASGFDRRRALG